MISFVIPVYRSAQSLQELHQRLTQTFTEERGSSEIICVEDCGDIVDSKSIMLKYPIKVSDAIDAISKSYYKLGQVILDKFRDIAVDEQGKSALPFKSLRTRLK